MNVRNLCLSLLILIFANGCVSNNIAWKTNENIKKISIGMSKNEVISILGEKYMITSSSKDEAGNHTETLGYKSDTAEEYKLVFINQKLTQWSREHIRKHLETETRKE